jgi:hypothetical protein
MKSGVHDIANKLLELTMNTNIRPNPAHCLHDYKFSFNNFSITIILGLLQIPFILTFITLVDIRSVGNISRVLYP